MKKLSYTNEQNVLSCAGCGESNLHQVGFVWFQRTEDAIKGTAYFIEEGGKYGDVQYLDGKDSPNPSARRHGSTVVFSCENCETLTGFHFAQHKGMTIIEKEKIDEQITKRKSSLCLDSIAHY